MHLLGLAVIMACFQLTGADLKVAVISDLKLSTSKEKEQKLNLLMAELNDSNVDQIMVIGDLAGNGNAEDIARIKERLKTFRRPCRVLTGNSDENYLGGELPLNPGLFKSSRYFADRIAPLILGISAGSNLKSSDKHYRIEDIAYLKEKLAERAANQRPTLVLGQLPLGSGVANGPEIAELLSNYKVLAWVCGQGRTPYRQNIYGIEHINCRQFYSHDGKNYGYNLIVYDQGKLEAWQKVLGDPVEKDFNTRPPLKKKETILGGNLPVNVNVENIWEESASIYTGVAMQEKDCYYGTSNGVLVRLLTNQVENPSGSPSRTLELTYPFFATPIANENTLIAGTLEKKILGIDAKTLKIRWEIPTDAPVANTGIWADNSVFIGLGAGSFARIEPESGKILWRTNQKYGAFQGTPATDGKIVVFGAWDTRLYALDAANGKPLWSWSNGSSQILFSPGNSTPAIAEKQVIFVAPDLYMTALNAADGKQIWRTNRFKFNGAFGRAQDGKTVYARTTDGLLIAVETGKGEFSLRWQCDLKYGYESDNGPLLEANGIVYNGNNSGVISAVDAGSGTMLWSYKAGTSAVNGFTAGPEGNVYASLQEGKIIRISSKNSAKGK